MLRRPRARLASGFLHSLHDCDALQRRFECNSDERAVTVRHCVINDVWWRHNRSAILREYVECTRDCATNMLAGRPCGAGRASARTLATALDTLRTSVGFVGLQERWHESVCLFCRMTNTSGCEPAARARTAISPSIAREIADELEKIDFDSKDDALYDAAEALFDAAQREWLDV